MSTMPSINTPVLLVGSHGMLAAAMRRSLSRRKVTDIHFVDRDECDVTSDNDVAATFDRVRPKLVINCSAYTAVDKAEVEEEIATQLNGAAVGRMAAVCREHGATFVHFGTDFVFDGQADTPYGETDEPAPVSAYGRSKLAGDKALFDSGGDDWLLLRTAWLYGPWAGRPFPKVMVDAAKAGKPLRVVSDQHGSPTLTIDLAETALDLLAGGHRGLFHVTGGGRTTWFDFTREILQQFKVTPKSLDPVTAADWAAMRPDSATRPAFSVLDTSKVEAALGRSMRDWKIALQDYRDLVAAEP
ncbi:MAG: dTDP-4-dehydrorhamnose reductase [Planctomycetota bacterium]